MKDEESRICVECQGRWQGGVTHRRGWPGNFPFIRHSAARRSAGDSVCKYRLVYKFRNSSDGKFGFVGSGQLMHPVPNNERANATNTAAVVCRINLVLMLVLSTAIPTTELSHNHRGNTNAINPSSDRQTSNQGSDGGKSSIALSPASPRRGIQCSCRPWGETPTRAPDRQRNG